MRDIKTGDEDIITLLTQIILIQTIVMEDITQKNMYCKIKNGQI